MKTTLTRNDQDPNVAPAPAGHEEPQRSVLVVDDDRALCHLVKSWLLTEGYQVHTFQDGQTALAGLGRFLPDAICLDLNMPGLSGLRTLEQIRDRHPDLPVLILTADTNVESIVQVMKLGAYDYLPKPIHRPDLANRLQHAIDAYRMTLKLAQLERDVSGSGFSGIVGNSEPMRSLYRQMDRLSNSDITVLIQGESGTGKELVAQALHQQSHRRAGPFVPVNCAAIPETLQESELFGHEKGAFTGATTRRAGRFEQAHRGTLFLDEVAELAPAAQAKLLRVLQEQRFVRVGGDKEVTSEFRLIAATHRDLGQKVNEGHFRADLYFRIAVFELEVPPLRRRAGDILELVKFFQREFARREQRTPGSIGAAALEVLQRYTWPGNVRELQNAVQRGTVASDGGVIERDHLPPRLLQAISAAGTENAAQTLSPVAAGTTREALSDQQTVEGQTLDRPTIALEPAPDEANHPSLAAGNATRHPDDVESRLLASDPIRPLEDVERDAIVAALDQLGGNLSKVCRELGIGRTTLYRKLKRYGLR